MDVVVGGVGRIVAVGRILLTSAWDEAGGADIVLYQYDKRMM